MVKLYGFCLSIAYIARQRHPYIESLPTLWFQTLFLLQSTLDTLPLNSCLSTWNYAMKLWCVDFSIAPIFWCIDVQTLESALEELPPSTQNSLLLLGDFNIDYQQDSYKWPKAMQKCRFFVFFFLCSDHFSNSDNSKTFVSVLMGQRYYHQARFHRWQLYGDFWHSPEVVDCQSLVGYSGNLSREQ